jgi:hypothetical protein
MKPSDYDMKTVRKERTSNTLLDEALEVIAKRPDINLEELEKALGWLWLPEPVVTELKRRGKLK